MLPQFPTSAQLAEHVRSDLDHAVERADMQRLAEVGRAHLSTLPDDSPALAEAGRAMEKLTPLLQQPRRVVTVHSRYGQPPGDLPYIEVQDWTDAQQKQAQRWLRNCMAVDWWRAQAAAKAAS